MILLILYHTDCSMDRHKYKLLQLSYLQPTSRNYKNNGNKSIELEPTIDALVYLRIQNLQSTGKLFEKKTLSKH